MGKKVLYVSIGDEVRSFIKQESYLAQHMDSINRQGELQPEIFPLIFFFNKIKTKYSGKEIIVVNGSPRSEKELMLWASLITVGYISNACIINLEVSDDVCIERLEKRLGRPDTQNKNSLKTKLGWYAPIREMLKSKLPNYFRIITIDGIPLEKIVFEDLKLFFAKEFTLQT